MHSITLFFALSCFVLFSFQQQCSAPQVDCCTCITSSYSGCYGWCAYNSTIPPSVNTTLAYWGACVGSSSDCAVIGVNYNGYYQPFTSGAGCNLNGGCAITPVTAPPPKAPTAAPPVAPHSGASLTSATLLFLVSIAMGLLYL